NQDFMNDGARLKDRETHHRCGEDQGGAERGPECRSMHPLIKALQLKQAQGSDECRRGSCQQEEPDDHCCPGRKVRSLNHSITSPRIRNLTSATVPANPRRPMASAASK